MLKSTEAFELDRATEVQVGPTFWLKYYMIFYANVRMVTVRDIQWKEEYAKCKAAVVRVPSKDSSSSHWEYEFRTTEDLNDGRFHEELGEDQAKEAKDGFIAGRQRSLSIHKIARLFYQHAGSLLNLEESLSPVLIVKLNHAAPRPEILLEQRSESLSEEAFAAGNETEDDTDEHRGIPGQIEWIAFEVYDVKEETDGDDTSEEEGEDEDTETEKSSADINTLTNFLSKVDLDAEIKSTRRSQEQAQALSILEYILRLCAVETFEQTSFLNLTDEQLALFLRDDNPVNAANDRMNADQFQSPSSQYRRLLYNNSPKSDSELLMSTRSSSSPAIRPPSRMGNDLWERASRQSSPGLLTPVNMRRKNVK